MATPLIKQCFKWHLSKFYENPIISSQVIIVLVMILLWFWQQWIESNFVGLVIIAFWWGKKPFKPELGLKNVIKTPSKEMVSSKDVVTTGNIIEVHRIVLTYRKMLPEIADMKICPWERCFRNALVC